MSKNSRANYGTVEVEIGGKQYTLKPTLLAVDKICKQWPGGMSEAIAAIQDPLRAIRSCSFVIAAGAGIPSSEVESLADEVFSEGIAAVQEPTVKYLLLLINPTGKSKEDEASGE